MRELESLGFVVVGAELAELRRAGWSAILLVSDECESGWSASAYSAAELESTGVYGEELASSPIYASAAELAAALAPLVAYMATSERMAEHGPGAWALAVVPAWRKLPEWARGLVKALYGECR